MRTGTALIVGIIFLTMAGCKKEESPKLSGQITLSSQLMGTESYFLYGYAFESAVMYAYPHSTDPLPDIINEGYLVMDGEQLVSKPGFNTPGQVNGFALVGEFISLLEAEDFYDAYAEVEEDLYFETVSDIVELYQVWVQQTSSGKYVKMLVRDIQNLESAEGDKYNEVTLEYTYAQDGSTTFSCGCG